MKAMIQELEEPDAQMPAATVSNFTGSVRFTYMWCDDHKYVEHIYIYMLGAGGSPMVLSVGYCQGKNNIISL